MPPLNDGALERRLAKQSNVFSATSTNFGDFTTGREITSNMDLDSLDPFNVLARQLGIRQRHEDLERRNRDRREARKDERRKVDREDHGQAEGDNRARENEQERTAVQIAVQEGGDVNEVENQNGSGEGTADGDSKELEAGDVEVLSPVRTESRREGRKRRYLPIPEEHFPGLKRCEVPSELPESDLLRAIHYRATEVYRELNILLPPTYKNSKKEFMHRSLEGSALIAMGVLFEEIVKDQAQSFILRHEGGGSYQPDDDGS